MKRLFLKSISLAAGLTVLAACSDAVDATAVISRNNDFTGRGNIDEPLLTIVISADSNAFCVRNVKFVLNADANDVSAIKLIQDSVVLAEKKVNSHHQDYSLRCKVASDSAVTLKLCADIRDNATEGNTVSADVRSIRIGRNNIIPEPVEPGGREILLCRMCLYSPGDYGSN